MADKEAKAPLMKRGLIFSTPPRSNQSMKGRGTMKRILTVLIAILLALTLLGGCTGTSAATVKTTDIQGNAVDVPASAQKIISLSPSTTELIYALGAQDKLVGVDKYSTYPEEAKSKTQVGDYSAPDIEKIISLKPDLVLAGEKLQTSTISKLKELGIATMAVEARHYEDIPKTFELVGTATGKTAEAKALIDKLKAKEDEIKGKVAGQKTPTVYFVLSFGAGAGNWTSGPGSFINSMIAVAGGDCVTNHVDPNAPWMDYNLEKLVSQNPEIILLDQFAGEPDKLKAEEGYKSLDAVKNGKIYVTNNELAWPGPRIINGLDTLAKILHPDLFK